MYCPVCGAKNDEAARFCTTCGLDLEKVREQWWESGGKAEQQSNQQPYQRAYGQTSQPNAPARPAEPYGARSSYGVVHRIPSYMAWAIAVLILCFWPTGIVAVVYASRVIERLALGDIPGAQEASRKAKMWCWITFAIGIVAWVVGGIFLVGLFAATGAGIGSLHIFY